MGTIRIVQTPTALPEQETLRKEFDAALHLMDTFFEWRHRLIVRYAIAVSAILVAWASQSQHVLLRIGLLLVGAIVSAIVGQLDLTNQTLIWSAYAYGVEVEKKLGIFMDPQLPFDPDPALKSLQPTGGFFWMLQLRSHSIGRLASYHNLLRIVYFGGAAVFAAGALVQAIAH